ncbi:hypothetical protein GCM10027296_28800 [Chitinimonas naiadis]
MLGSEAEARSVLAGLRSGKASFDKLAVASRDTSSATEGGELGWLLPEFLPPPIAAAVLAQGKAGLLPDPIPTPLGWHVIEIEGMRAPAGMTHCDFDCTLRRHLDAIDQRDWPAFEATLTRGDTLSLILPNGRLSTDGTTFRKQMQAWLADKDWQWQYSIVHQRQGKGWGLAVLKVTYQDKDEQGQPYRLDYLLQLLFEPEAGHWRLIHDQNTLLKKD